MVAILRPISAQSTALVGGVTINETGSGAPRTVEEQDVNLTTDLAHPKRSFRLWIESR